jgi:hypothetical protein
MQYEHLKFANTNKQDGFCSHLAQGLTFETKPIFREKVLTFILASDQTSSHIFC